ncbi:MAG: thioredoxin domain-containing protein [SAR202 cluster bacterium]|nr:thioredoxin domain-containing protein [SAR202 cluster bacterium]
MPNRLAGETSPYLLQHRDNPVDWYPWGAEALEKARAEDRPIFLSIGYSACHWCHVMEHESFEDEATARLMNENFVSIKVDREERPDLDSIYMTATQLISGQGGWPMSVFLTPDGRPFYAGTYFPPEDVHGRPSFKRVLSAVAEAYRERREEILAGTGQLLGQIAQQVSARGSDAPLSRDTLSEAFRVLARDFDPRLGGFGTAPKFPQPMTYEFLLRHWRGAGNEHALTMAELTLEKMAAGGMYDQLGGGFHRYSTDGAWLVPHFEKMLYDNGLLAQLYLHAFQATGRPVYRRVVDEILAYLEREMLSPRGGFYSAQDADSEGEEGRYFVWWASEIDRILGPELSRIARVYWDITDDGNFEGRNILSVPRPAEEAAAELGMPASDLAAAIDRARSLLLAERSKRVKPLRDDKVLTAWNALVLRAFAEAGAALENPHYLHIAKKNGGFLLSELVRDGRLLRTWKADAHGAGTARLNAYLEDYAYLVDALTALFEATFEERWLIEAEKLAEGMLGLFWSSEDQVFFDTGSDHERLVVRPRDIFDNATPCGGSAAAVALIRLARLTGRSELEGYAAKSLRSVRDFVARAPAGMGHWLAALDLYTSPSREMVVIGDQQDRRTLDLLAVYRRGYHPTSVLAGSPDDAATHRLPLLTGRTRIGGRPAAYVCENSVCQLPVNEPEALRAQLESQADRIRGGRI